MKDYTVRTKDEYRLFSREGDSLGTLKDVKRGGTVSRKANATLKSSGSIDLRNLPAQLARQADERDWGQLRIQPVLTVNDVEHRLGLFLPDLPESELSSRSRAEGVDLMDRLAVVDRDYFGQAYGVPKGSNIGQVVREIIESTGEPDVLIDDTSEELRNSVESETADSKLALINILLDAANFFALYTDGNGRFRAEPYIKPTSRGIAAEFSDESANMLDWYMPKFSREVSTWSPNVYIAISDPEDEDDEALIAEAVNDDPDDPESTVNRGRILPEDGPEEGVKTTSQSALQDRANRRLIESSASSEKITIEHLPIDGLTINSAVRFHSRRHGIEDSLWTVENQDWTLDTVPTVQAVLRRVKE